MRGANVGLSSHEWKDRLRFNGLTPTKYEVEDDRNLIHYVQQPFEFIFPNQCTSHSTHVWQLTSCGKRYRTPMRRKLCQHLDIPHSMTLQYLGDKICNEMESVDDLVQ